MKEMRVITKIHWLVSRRLAGRKLRGDHVMVGGGSRGGISWGSVNWSDWRNHIDIFFSKFNELSTSQMEVLFMCRRCNHGCWRDQEKKTVSWPKHIRISWETFGSWGQQVWNYLLKEIGRRTINASGNKRARANLFHKLQHNFVSTPLVLLWYPG